MLNQGVIEFYYAYALVKLECVFAQKNAIFFSGDSSLQCADYSYILPFPQTLFTTHSMHLSQLKSNTMAFDGIE